MAQERERGRGRGRGRGDDRNREQDGYEAVIKIKRCSAVVKGGRRFSFNALVVFGDKKGKVGCGYGKAKEVPPSVEKAVKNAQKAMKPVSLRGGTVPHRLVGRFGAAKVTILPASEGTGVIAGPGVREVMIAAGITDVLTKCTGSTNPINVVKAALDGLYRMRTREQVAELRGVAI